MKSYQTSIISLIILVSVLVLFAQSQSQLIKNAGSLRQSGMYEDALSLYQAVYNKGNRSFPVVTGITQCLENLKKYDELISFFDELQRQHPERQNYSVDKGRIHYLKGEPDRAFEIWKAVYSRAPDNYNGYRLVGSVMVQLRLYDEAIDLYKLALVNAKKSQTLHRDIAMLYRAQLNHENAALHYLAYYKFNPKQYSYVRQQIIGMASDDEAVGNILKGLKDFVRENSANNQISELQAELYIRSRDYESAYSIYQNLNHEKQDDLFLMRFASEAKKNKAFGYAIKAYLELLQNPKNRKVQLSVQLNLANTYYHYAQWLNRKGEKSQAEAEIQKSFKIINLISKEDINTPERWQAILLKAEIYQTVIHQLGEAVELYKSLLATPGSLVNIDLVHYKLGHVYLQQNKLAEADMQFQKIIGKQYRKIARYRQGEILYYQAQFTAAEKVFKELARTTITEDSLMNNLLSHISFIAQFKKDSLLLSIFSRAELLKRQKNEKEAAETFLQLQSEQPGIAKKAVPEAAGLFMKLDDQQNAIKVLKKLIEKYPLDADMDAAYFLLANALSTTQKNFEALDLYRLILANYPNSFYTEKTREKARIIAMQIKDIH